MTISTPLLASRFDACLKALREGLVQEAQYILRAIDPSGLQPASAVLHAKLSARAAGLAYEHIPRAPIREEGVSLLALDQAPPSPGVSIVSACMNRQSNLLKVLPSWLALPVEEIIIVDWSSDEELWPMLEKVIDPRLRVVRIDGERRWVLTHAFNVGLRLAQHDLVFKLDADIRIEADFLRRNLVSEGTFVRGFWKSAVDAGLPDQKFVNGSFGARKHDLRAIGYYDERILTYGWDDSDLYIRLAHVLGRAGHILDHQSLKHLDQTDSQRIENQDLRADLVLGRFAPTEYENLVNKFYTSMIGDWGSGSSPQDFCLEAVESNLWRGRRTTPLPKSKPEARRLAEVLGASHLVHWSVDIFPHIPSTSILSLEFARLLRDVREQGREIALINALRERRRIHLFRCPDPSLREALRATVGTLRERLPPLAEVFFFFESDSGTPLGEAAGAHGIGCLSRPLFDSLVHALQPKVSDDLLQLDRALSDDEGHTYLWTVGLDEFANSAVRQAKAITKSLGSQYVTPARPAPSSALVTSLYDERNLVRLLEYLTCVVLNLGAVERLLLCYEVLDGLLIRALQQIRTLLGVSPTRLVLVPLAQRPSFEELFALQSMIPSGTRLAVCNADVALDATFDRLPSLTDMLYAVSRRDVAPGGQDAELIRLENGTPNTLSADAWIVTTPFEPDFHLDYLIGTIHCDSFINNQVGQSSRYRLANPCLDVHVFHLHDARFNSSTEKKHRDRVQIERRLEAEQQRNGGLTPVMGAPWNWLEHCPLTASPALLIHWRPRALVLDLLPTLTIGTFIWLHLASRVLGHHDDVCIVARLSPETGAGVVGRLLARYKQHFELATLQIDLAGAPFDPSSPEAGVVESRSADATDLAEVLAASGLYALTSQLEDLLRFPTSPDISQLRAKLNVLDATDAQQGLLHATAKQAPGLLQELRAFIDSLEPWSDERRMLVPFDLDLDGAPVASPALHLARPRVSFVTSLFRGDDFLPGYLDNVAQAAVQAGGEVILVDANCDDHDSSALEAYFRGKPELRRWFDVIRLDTDPGLYACWQLAIERARAPYVTNANLDDRRSPQHTARLVGVLESRPELAAACGSITAVMSQAQGGWFDVLPNQVWFRDLGTMDFGLEALYRVDDDGTVRSHNVLHCMPVWRRKLHDTYGSFDEERYGTSADWAFWLLCAKNGEVFRLDSQAFGRYFVNPESHNRRHDAAGVKERRIIAELIGVQQDSVIKQ